MELINESKKILPLLPCGTKILFLFSALLFYNCEIVAQTYSGIVTFGNSSQYSFDFVVECDDPPTSATLTVTFSTPLPPALVPQLHLGGGVFVGMSGSGPFTYNFTGLVDCNFYFFFWMAYSAGGLYQSPSPLTTGNTTLPIFLSSFNVKPYDANSTELDWTSHTEINSDLYRIERSVDGLNWIFVDDVSAAGNSSSPISYSYLDKDISNGTEQGSLFYYRLKMIDLDGSYEYSDVLSVNFDTYMGQIITVYPNPFQDELLVDLSAINTQRGEIELEIYDVSGKMVHYGRVNNATFEILDLSDIPSGVYIIALLRNGKRIDQSRLVKAN
ncbi:MAG: T9SS type A sorting domain-containing protein [Flavobacteriales bacterium]|nr:T9SS type A sorting domain-containing protein [Flavobacteriales bacterium]